MPQSLDNSISINDGSCDVIEIRSFDKALRRVEKNLGKHDWLGRYVRLDWKNTSESKLSFTYRRKGKVIDVPDGDIIEEHYHVELYYVEELEYWGVSSNRRKYF